MKWISIKDRYPTKEENSGHLVVIDSHNPVVVHYGTLKHRVHHNKKFTEFNCYNCNSGECEFEETPAMISHWITLPAGP